MNSQTKASVKWRQKAGITKKTFDCPKDLANAFADACKRNGDSQAGLFKKMMRDYIASHSDSEKDD